MSEIKIDKIVYFVRHGQSVDNVSPVFQSPDSPLSEKGRMQAENIAERVSRLSFETLISSPLQRTRETAEAIARVTGKEPEYSDLFIERVNPTSIGGKSYKDEEANRTWREQERSFYSSGMRVEDGENYEDLITRADKALAFLNNRTEQSLVVVTHGYFLRTVVARVLLGNLLSGEALKNFQKSATMENTGITVLRYHDSFEQDPSWHLWIYNDHSHLG